MPKMYVNIPVPWIVYEVCNHHPFPPPAKIAIAASPGQGSRSDPDLSGSEVEVQPEDVWNVNGVSWFP